MVEDEEHLAAGIRFNLELEGYEVETVTDGLEAVSCLADDYLPKPFDLAVLLARVRGLIRLAPEE